MSWYLYLHKLVLANDIIFFLSELLIPTYRDETHTERTPTIIINKDVIVDLVIIMYIAKGIGSEINDVLTVLKTTSVKKRFKGIFIRFLTRINFTSNSIR